MGINLSCDSLMWLVEKVWLMLGFNFFKMRFFSGSKNLCYKTACSSNFPLFDLFSLKRSLGILHSLFQYFQNLRLLSSYLRKRIFVFHEDHKTIILNDEKKKITRFDFHITNFG